MKTIFFYSLGCSRNLVDSEIMIGILQDLGFKIAKSVSVADFIIVNTCGFIESAREEAFFILKEAFKNKKEEGKVIVCGCMVKNFFKFLKESFPDVFCFLGSGNVEDIKKAVLAKEKTFFMDKKSYLKKKNIPRSLSHPNFAYVKIAEGCLNNCAYCLIPKIKGKLVSKPIKDILVEIKELLEKGIFEIILTGQDLGDYGKDLKKGESLEKLLKEILKIKKDFWIRLLYMSLKNISKELLSIMRKDKRICNYLDVSLQHVNDDILKRMRRGQLKKEVIIEKLKEIKKDFIVRTPFITGFPGEGEKEFLELLDFIKEIKLDHVGIFGFSKEKGTEAFNMKNQVDKREIEKRVKILYDEQKKIVKQKNRRFLKKRYQVVLDGYHEKSKLLIGSRFYGQAPEVDGSILINDISKIDSFKNRPLVEIKDFVGYDLIGEIIENF